MSDRYKPKIGRLRVSRPDPIVQQSIRRSFGPGLGDEYETTVRRSGSTVTIIQNRASKQDWSMSTEEAEALLEVLANVLDEEAAKPKGDSDE